MSNWIPNSYEKEGIDRGYAPQYLRQLLKDGKSLIAKNVPVIFSLRHLAAIVDVPFGDLRNVVSRKVDAYRSYSMRKRSGGYRQIAIPESSLLKTQRWIDQNILDKMAVHSCSKAYSPKCSPLKNAVEHCEAKFLVKIDITRFFESITERQVYNVFRKMGYRAIVAFELTRLTTKTSPRSRKKYKSKRWASNKDYSFYTSKHIGHLPQGAPTSPKLSNLIFQDIDLEIMKLANIFEYNYTRYADDITFSGVSFNRNDALKIIKDCSDILSKYGFKRNNRKTVIVPPGARKVVTGLLVDRDKPKLCNEFREKIELHLYYAKKYGVAEHCGRRGFESIIGFRNHLHGLLQYALHVDPNVGKKYLQRFKEIAWPVS